MHIINIIRIMYFSHNMLSINYDNSNIQHIHTSSTWGSRLVRVEGVEIEPASFGLPVFLLLSYLVATGGSLLREMLVSGPPGEGGVNFQSSSLVMGDVTSK